jgi:D-alanine transaminase
MMLTSATKEVVPITMFDGKPVGTGKPGPVYAKLRAGYDEVIARL